MDFKQFYKTINFDIDNELRTVFQATQGDTKSRGLLVDLIVGGVKTPVTTEKMTFFALKPDGTRVMTVGVKEGTGFRIDFTNQTFAVPGVLLCTLVLSGTNGEKIADKKFKMTVDSSLEDGAIISEDERGILDRAFDLASDIVPRLEALDVPLLENLEQEVITARGTEATLGARLDSTDAQLAEVNDGRIVAKNIIANNDFTQGLTFWKTHFSNLSLVGGVLRATGTGAYRIIGTSQKLDNVPDGLYYLRARIRTLSDGADSLAIFDGSTVSVVVDNPQKNQWYEISGVQNFIGNQVYTIGIFPNATIANGAIIEMEKPMMVNLTEAFGVGNEPMASEMDAILQRVGWFSTEKELATLKTLTTEVETLKALTTEVETLKALVADAANKEYTKPLHGKKIVFAGDSVTEFGNFPEVAGEKTGAEVIKIGIGGSCMFRHPLPNYDVFSMTNLADAIATGDWSAQIANKITAPDDNNTIVVDRMIAIDWNTVDILCINHGTNDTRQGSAYDFGTEGDFGKTSFIGGLAYIVETILTAYPHISIVFITPTWRKLDGVDADTVLLDNGKYLVDYIDAIIKNAEKYKTPVKDMYRTSGFNKFTADLYLDGDVHPNATGYKHFGNKVGAFLLSHF